MSFVIPVSRRKMVGLAGACVLVLGSGAALAVSGAGAADAATCTTGAPCTAFGTANLNPGTLSLTAPDTLTWTATLTGAPLQVADALTGDQSLTVDDATGSGAGWALTATATQFTTGGGSPATLTTAGTLSVNGSPTSETADTAPDAVCTVAGDCTLPSGNLESYPVPVTTDGSTAATLYTAAASSGFGSILLGSADPIGWWLSLPSNTLAGTYTSTVDLNIVSGP